MSNNIIRAQKPDKIPPLPEISLPAGLINRQVINKMAEQTPYRPTRCYAVTDDETNGKK